MNESLDLLDWCTLLLDDRRVAPHAAALRAAITAGSTVVDIGTGLGIFALLACRYGARKVYAIDSRPTIHLAREIAAANGVADRIEFIQDDPRRITLPHQADVIVADVRSVLLEYQVPVMLDARRRLLAPGGTLVPQIDRLWASVAYAAARHEGLVGVWMHHPHGFDAAPAFRRSSHTWLGQRFGPEELVSEPVCWAAIDYRTQEATDVEGTMAFAFDRPVTGHGLCVWFDANLAPGVPLANAPEGPRSLYGTAFFPWPTAIDFREGDCVSVTMSGRLTQDGYHWRWKTTVRNGSDAVTVSFDQDTARHTTPLDATAISGSDGRHAVSAHDDDLRVDRYALAEMDRGLTIGAIAGGLAQAFPSRFGSRGEALTYAGQLSQRYG